MYLIRQKIGALCVLPSSYNLKKKVDKTRKIIRNVPSI